MKNKLFTIIITNYNQEKFIFEAIDSVLKQSFKNIELIITDDCSNYFDQEKIAKYIKNNSNIKCQIIVNEKNLGTIKTLNKALRLATGDYVLFFAADDALKNKNVLQNFVKEFNNHPKIKIISSVSILYNEDMKKIINIWPNQKEINSFNKLSAFKQNKMLRFGPIFAPGATAYRKNVFDELNYLDEKYVLIEDWSLFLKLTRLNYKIFISNFPSLKHRGGGVSEELKLSKKIIDDIVNDSDLIYKSEIFPYFKQLNTQEKLKVLERYHRFGYTYGIKYKNVFKKYYGLILSNADILIYKLLHSVKIKKYFNLPLLSLFIIFGVYLIIRNDYILIFGSVIMYLIINKLKCYYNKERSGK